MSLDIEGILVGISTTPLEQKLADLVIKQQKKIEYLEAELKATKEKFHAELKALEAGRPVPPPKPPRKPVG